MKVLMTADTLGGVWTYAGELVRELGQSGCVVSLATMGRPLAVDQRTEAESIPNLCIYESSHKLEWMDDPWPDVDRAGEWLLEIEERERPDVVHLNGYAHGCLPWRSPVLVVGHSCVLSWWSAVKGEPAPSTWNTYRRKVRRGLQVADAVAAPTAGMMGELQRFYGPLSATYVIPNGRQRDEYAPKEKEPLVLTAGRLWDEAKNIRLLCQAAPAIDWPVYVAGESADPSGRSEPVEGVRLLGRLDASDLADLFGRAAIYASPARYEPFGLANLEAALSGCALVLADIPTLREVWGDSAVFVPPDDATALASAINRLIKDERERHRMAALAVEQAGRYSPEAMAHEYRRLYHRMLTSTATPGAVTAGNQAVVGPV